MSAPLLLAIAAVAASPTPDSGGQWRFAGGVAFDSQPHGTVELAYRDGPLRALFHTDTLDVRWAPEVPGGRVWVAARAEALIAGLMPAPWTDGAPDPTRALYASYAGLEGGRIFHLSNGWWAGGELVARVHLFGRPEGSVAQVPPTSPIATPTLVAGWWSKDAQLYAKAGTDVRAAGLSPMISSYAQLHPAGSVAPRVELRAGLAQGQDAITRTRLGGVVPYSVPVGGTSWAEWWVEDFTAVRAGVTARWSDGHASLLADAAWFDGERAEGVAVDVRHSWKPWFLEIAAGYAPFVERKPGIYRWSTWLRAGCDWQPW